MYTNAKTTLKLANIEVTTFGAIRTTTKVLTTATARSTTLATKTTTLINTTPMEVTTTITGLRGITIAHLDVIAHPRGRADRDHLVDDLLLRRDARGAARLHLGRHLHPLLPRRTTSMSAHIATKPSIRTKSDLLSR
jgi:hypothetical protein